MSICSRQQRSNSCSISVQLFMGLRVQLSAMVIKRNSSETSQNLYFSYKNTPVHWGDFASIKQEYSLVQRKKFIGTKIQL